MERWGDHRVRGSGKVRVCGWPGRGREAVEGLDTSRCEGGGGAQLAAPWSGHWTETQCTLIAPHGLHETLPLRRLAVKGQDSRSKALTAHL